MSKITVALVALCALAPCALAPCALAPCALAQEPPSAPTPDEAAHASQPAPASTPSGPAAATATTTTTATTATTKAAPAPASRPPAGQEAQQEKPAANDTADQQTYKMKDGGMYQPPAQRPASPAMDLETYGRT